MPRKLGEHFSVPFHGLVIVHQHGVACRRTARGKIKSCFQAGSRYCFAELYIGEIFNLGAFFLHKGRQHMVLIIYKTSLFQKGVYVIVIVCAAARTCARGFPCGVAHCGKHMLVAVTGQSAVRAILLSDSAVTACGIYCFRKQIRNLLLRPAQKSNE